MSESHLNIEEHWQPFADLMPVSVLAASIVTPQMHLEDPLETIIPSIQLLPDGPFVASIFLLTSSVLCEVRPQEGYFDFNQRYNVRHQRWRMSETSGQTPESASISYKIVSVEIWHNASNVTGMTYIGQNDAQRQTWIDRVRLNFPPGMLRAD